MTSVGVLASAVHIAGVTYDTLTAVGSTYAGASNEGGTALNVGLTYWQRTSPAQTLLVRGVRYWRTAQNQASAPTVGLAILGGAALKTQVSAAGAGSKTAGWEQVLFATPYTLATNDDYLVWVGLPSGGYPATGSAYTIGQASQQGLFTITATVAGIFRYTTDGTLPPINGTGSSFWVEPLVTLSA